MFCLIPYAHGFEVSHGDKKFEITKISSELSKQYGIAFEINAIVVASSAADNSNYRKQWELIEKIDAEQYQIVYVSALESESASKHGYYTTKEVAGNILSGKGFLIRIYSPSGELLVSSDAILSTEKLLEFLPKP